MSAHVLDTLLPLLRHQPTSKRVRATVGDELVVDSTQAVLVWEPQRVVPVYAVPREHVLGELEPATATPAIPGSVGFRLPGGQVVLDPSVPFAVHTSDGEPLSLYAAGQHRPGVAFRVADPDLHGLVLLDPAGFDGWYEEDEPLVGHARDLFQRIDILPSSRPVRIELEGILLADSARAQLLYEHPLLPVRAYLPPEDTLVPLRPNARRTHCPLKGEATYWSIDAGGHTIEDVAWSYPTPNEQAARIAGLVCFFNERVDISFGGQGAARPHTPWSSAV